MVTRVLWQNDDLYLLQRGDCRVLELFIKHNGKQIGAEVIPDEDGEISQFTLGLLKQIAEKIIEEEICYYRCLWNEIE